MTAQTIDAPSARPPLWKTYLLILAPMTLTSVLQSAAGTVDGIYLGRMIGVHALAAVAAFFPVFFFLLALVIGVSSGATVLVGRAWGAQDHARVHAIAGTALCLAYGTGAVIALAGSVATPHLMAALGTPANVLADATRYARLMLLGMPLIFTLWLVNSLSRGVGDAVTPLRALALAAAISLLGTPAFIGGWLGLPRLGVASPAFSTLLAFFVALVWTVVYALRTGHPLAPRLTLLRQLRIDLQIARAILRIGIPAALNMLAMAVAELVLLGLVNRHGSTATAAYGAVTQVMSWVQMPVMSLGITASILASHAIGAGRAERLDTIAAAGARLNLVVTGAFIVITYACAPLVLALFVADAAVVTLATKMLRIVLWSTLALGFATILSGVMRASGTVLVPTALTVFAILGVELPAAYALHARLGMDGIWWSYSIAFVAMLVLQSMYYRLACRTTPSR
jgi:putative MATE family efflux protein